MTSVLEIGVGGLSSWHGYETSAGGQSLRMWSRFFPKARILGVDIHEKAIRGKRIRFEQGDQTDAAFLRRLVAEYGPFDLVIDDGSHVGEHIIASHRELWSSVKSGGYYVIEDLETAYDPEYGGGPEGALGTGVALVKHLVDDVIPHDGSGGPEIAGLHVYAGIAFIQRA